MEAGLERTMFLGLKLKLNLAQWSMVILIMIKSYRITSWNPSF